MIKLELTNQEAGIIDRALYDAWNGVIGDETDFINTRLRKEIKRKLKAQKEKK